MTHTEKMALAMAWYDSGLEDRAEFQTLMESLFAQPEQEPASVTYKEVQDSMNALEKGDLRQQVIAEELGQRKLYTAPPKPAQEPPPWWPAVENILTEYGLQAIDFVADFKAALAQPAQEPVANDRALQLVTHQLNHWVAYATELRERLNKYEGGAPMLLNITPPQRTWVDLTYDERYDCVHSGAEDSWDVALLVEAKLKEKNNG